MPSVASQRAHVSFPTRHLERAIDFYSALFGMPPTKRKADYAKFSCDAPSINFSLTKTDVESPATRAHYGVEVADAAAVRALKERLDAAGLHTGTIDTPRCCYAVQTKFWVTDPDGNPWEIFSVHEDTDQFGEHAKGASRSGGAGARGCCDTDGCT